MHVRSAEELVNKKLLRVASTTRLLDPHNPQVEDIIMETELIKVTGMTCGGCTSKVTKALKAVPGVGDVAVSLETGEATVQYDARSTTPAQLSAALKGAGYGVHVPGDTGDSNAKAGCCS